VEPPARDREPRSPWHACLDDWIAPYVRDSTLWPVLFVIWVHAAAFLAPLLLMALRERHPIASASIAILAVGSSIAAIKEARLRGHPRELTALLVATWLGGGAAAWLADAYGLF